MVNKKFSKIFLFKKNDYLLIVGFFLFILGILSYTFFSKNSLPQTDNPIQFEIRTGENLEAIIDSLSAKKIIPSNFNMRIAVFIKGAERRIKAGVYFVDKPMNYLELVDLIVDDNYPNQKKITIPEGIEQNKLASLLKREIGIDSTKFMLLSQDKNLIHSLSLDVKNLEGYLLPNTYYVLPSWGEQAIISKLNYEMQKLFDESAKKKLKELKMNVHQILTLASIIDGESNDFSEFKRISAVYHNRLKKRMALQADPTIVYLIRNRVDREISKKDLQINSLYNTYKYAGLPPGPINNPGKDAILAALYPEKNNYLYFVANGKGSHIFASTYEQHTINVQRYRRWLRLQK